MNLRTFVSIVCLMTIVSVTSTLAVVQVNLYEQDGVTPFSPRPLMEGTKLVVVVRSDQAEFWNGGLFIEGDNRALGFLSGRDYDLYTDDWSGSHTPAAGEKPVVRDYRDSEIWGFDLYTGPNQLPVPGDWFVLDYQAIGIGEPNIMVYDYSASWDIPDPNRTISFSQVRSRDFNDDGYVNYLDFTLFPPHWLDPNCTDPNGCGLTDLDNNHAIDLNDLVLFSDFWLWPEVGTLPINPPPVNPQITYHVVDSSLNTDITLDIGTTTTLYLYKTSEPNSEMLFFDVEVQLSDIALGSIDNRELDANNPSGPGTARILITPRWEEFDIVGPGIIQSEGIRLGAITDFNDPPFADGFLASFEYTAQQTGDVTLSVQILDGPAAYTQKIHVRQIDPNAPQAALSPSWDRPISSPAIPEWMSDSNNRQADPEIAQASEADTSRPTAWPGWGYSGENLQPILARPGNFFPDVDLITRQLHEV